MQLIPLALRGPLFMIIATGAYVINDSMMKLATVGLPPYQVLFMRGVAATLWCIPILFLLGYTRNLPQIANARVVARNVIELFAVLCFVVALANMPIADATALGQITPLILLLGASVLFGERIGALRMSLIGLGFVGALMVAQPTMEGVSIYAVLALINAILSAGRDLAGRKVAAHIPGMIVACSACVVVMTGAGIAHLVSEAWVTPGPRHLLLLGGAGLFLIFGHFFLFMAYRVGEPSIVAPFFYCFTIWAVISGLVVFGELPNWLAMVGILLVVSSGLAIVMLDRRRQKIAVSA